MVYNPVYPIVAREENLYLEAYNTNIIETQIDDKDINVQNNLKGKVQHWINQIYNLQETVRSCKSRSRITKLN